MRLTFAIQRFNPEIDAAPHVEEYRLDVSRGMTVLDALIRIQNEQDGTLALRYSCRSAICGSCPMTINGTEKLACRTSVRQEWERHGGVTVAPLRHMAVLKDLVVDLAPFWEKIRGVTPWLGATPHVPTDPTGQMTIPASAVHFHNVDACIMCGACVAACTAHEVSPTFLGPAALAKADRFVEDPRESSQRTYWRLVQLEGEDGIWDCTRCNCCVQVCPKDVRPMEAIVRLRRSSIQAGLTSSEGARHIIGFVDLVRQQGRLNEARMPLKIIGRNLGKLLRVIPRGLRMLLKGKVPNPFEPAIEGIDQVRAVFSATPSPRRSSR